MYLLSVHILEFSVRYESVAFRSKIDVDFVTKKDENEGIAILGKQGLHSHIEMLSIISSEPQTCTLAWHWKKKL